jgi:hypothetical protein
MSPYEHAMIQAMRITCRQTTALHSIRLRHKGSKESFTIVSLQIILLFFLLFFLLCMENVTMTSSTSSEISSSSSLDKRYVIAHCINKNHCHCCQRDSDRSDSIQENQMQQSARCSSLKPKNRNIPLLKLLQNNHQESSHILQNSISPSCLNHHIAIQLTFQI